MNGGPVTVRSPSLEDFRSFDLHELKIQSHLLFHLASPSASLASGSISLAFVAFSEQLVFRRALLEVSRKHWIEVNTWN